MEFVVPKVVLPSGEVLRDVPLPADATAAAVIAKLKQARPEVFALLSSNYSVTVVAQEPPGDQPAAVLLQPEERVQRPNIQELHATRRNQNMLLNLQSQTYPVYDAATAASASEVMFGGNNTLCKLTGNMTNCDQAVAATLWTCKISNAAPPGEAPAFPAETHLNRGGSRRRRSRSRRRGGRSRRRGGRSRRRGGRSRSRCRRRGSGGGGGGGA